jgi:hypothetical protein
MFNGRWSRDQHIDLLLSTAQFLFDCALGAAKK